MFGFLHDVFDKLGQVTAQRQQSELEQLLRLAKDEITSLRRENELLLARVETMELCALLLRASPREQIQTLGEDVAWLLDRKLKSLLDEKLASADLKGQSLG